MNKLRNPIIPGFFPDPSICRVGDDYYVACSSFELDPGIPIFHSKDLANWKLIGFALTDEAGFHTEKNGMIGGVMAPTIRYYNGTFYIIVANFADQGNMIVTATDPAGPWSRPHYLNDVPGIDASIFFDNDGKCYVMGTGNVWDNGAGVMERGIWIASYDIENYKMTGEPFTIYNNALRVATSPEAPHLYHIGDYYYLIIAEGGTEHYHSVVVARSKELFSFFEGNPANPVMTHRHMGYKCPIGNVGHADIVELPDGSWYAVMLASRLIGDHSKNIGRETFICPVVWERDWPLFSPETGKIEWEYDAPSCLPWTPVSAEPEKDDFDEDKLGLTWAFWGTPYEKFYEIRDSKLVLSCIPQSLTDEILPTSFGGERSTDLFAGYLAKRQLEISQTVTTEMEFVPEGDEEAGLALVRAMNHQLHLRRVLKNGKQILQAVLYTTEYDLPPYIPGFKYRQNVEVLAEVPWDDKKVVLRLVLDGNDYKAFYGANENELTMLCSLDGALINTEQVGCMTGTMLGVYASGNGKRVDNEAAFDWFELK